MKDKTFSILMGAATLGIVTLGVVGNVLAFGLFDPVLTSYFGLEGTSNATVSENQYFKRKFSSEQEALTYMEDLSKQIEAEGSVLLRNEQGALPLAQNSKVSLFSISSVDFYAGGTYGSGAISDGKILTLRNVLENKGIIVNPTLDKFYNSMKSKYKRKVGGLAQGTSKDPYKWGINEVPQSEYTNEVKNSYKDYADAGIVVITRPGAENGDLPRDMSTADANNHGHILQLDANEKALLQEVRSQFGKVIVLLNTATTFECGFLEDYGVDACLWVGSAGLGMQSIADVLVGEVNPSGRTVDTYAYDLFSSPAMQNMGNFAFVNGKQETGHHYVSYAEGIYVGYKYYETRYEDSVLQPSSAGQFVYDETVQYPFGYGLSYTSFAWSDYKMERTEDTIELSVTVKNVGNRAGKEVVEAYFQSPYTDYDREHRVEKAAVNLVDIAKTSLLPPNGEETVHLSFTIDDMKSYDAQGAGTYILESSDDYYVTLAQNAHEATKQILKAKGQAVEAKDGLTSSISVQEKDVSKDEVTGTEVRNLFDDAKGNVTYLSRSNWKMMDENGLRDGEAFGHDSDGDIFSTPITDELKAKLELKGYAASEAPEEEFVMPTTGSGGKRKLIEFRGKDATDEEWEELLDQVEPQEMIAMAKSSGHHTYAMVSVGKPYTTDTDGPVAWKSFVSNEEAVGGLPAEIVQASTYNKDLAYEIGEIMGELCLWLKVKDKEHLSKNLTGWYAPAMNLHRTPFGGRNFEYYSEDAMLSGIIGSRVVKGATDKGVVTYIKHFALNEQETNRMTDNVTWAQEQSIRELYLKPFEMAVKEGKSLGVMSSYNRIGTVWTGGNYHLLTGVLRKEWGFHGFVITDYMDGDYENIDQMLAAGGDAALYSMNDKPLTTSGAQALTYLRRATKHCLYAFANSNAMNGITTTTVITTGTPIYHKYVIAFDLFFGSVAFFTGFLCIFKMVKALKQRKDKKEGKEEIEEETKVPLIYKIILGVVSGTLALSSGTLALVTAKRRPSNVEQEGPSTSEEEPGFTLDPNVDLLEKYGSPRQYNLKDGSETMTFDLHARGYFYEAELATLSSPAKVNNSIIASAGACVGSFNPGAQMTFEIIAEEESDVLLMASSGYWSNKEMKISDYLSVLYGSQAEDLKYKVDVGERTFLGSGNYNSFLEFSVGEMHLQKGKNYIQFNSYGDAINYDFISLIKPWDKTSDEVEETVNLKEKYGEVAKKNLRDATSSKQFDDAYRGYYYEADSADEISEKVQVKDNAGASNGKALEHMDPGQYFVMKIHSSVEADVLLMMSGAKYVNTESLMKDIVRVQYGTSLETLDQTVDSQKQLFKGYNSWSTFKEFYVGELHLVKGDNYIRFLSLSAVNYDYIALVNPYDTERDDHGPEEEEVDLNLKYGEVSQAELKNGTTAMGFSPFARGYFYEAENAELSDGISIETKSASSGGKNIGRFQDGRTMTFHITSTVERTVLLRFALTRWNDGEILMSDTYRVEYGVDEQHLSESISFFDKTIPNYKTWDNFTETNIGEVNLKKGSNCIRVTAIQATNIDYISLIQRVEDVEVGEDPFEQGQPDLPDQPDVPNFMEKYGEYTKQDCLDGTETKQFDDQVHGYFYEAESAELSDGIRVYDNGNASNGKHVGSFQNGRVMTFEIHSSVESDVLIKFALTRYNSGSIAIANTYQIAYGMNKEQMTSASVFSQESIPNLGTWDQFVEYDIAEIHLKEGVNYIQITAVKDATNLDYMCLIHALA